MDEYYRVVKSLPESLSETLCRLAPQYAPMVQEIRLRAEQPLLFTIKGALARADEYFSSGHDLSKISDALLQTCFLRLCDHSVYAHEEELRQGYLTLPGGHRVGVAGCWNNGYFSHVSSLNLRVARWVTCDLPAQIRCFLKDSTGGLLIAGPPGSGKTTFLRSIATYLSAGKEIVCVVDERGELMAGQHTNFPFARRISCDVYTQCPKAEGIFMALRCMNPHTILCDELGSAEDLSAVEQGIASGVRFLASIHCGTREELRQKPLLNHLLRTGAFCQAVFLQGREAPGTVAEWMELP